jgi:hypothetical protein
VGGEALYAGAGRRAKGDSCARRGCRPAAWVQIAVPRWSPDGKKIAFIGGLMSDQGSTGGDVWIVSAAEAASRAT